MRVFLYELSENGRNNAVGRKAEFHCVGGSNSCPELLPPNL